MVWPCSRRQALGKNTGRDHAHLALHREDQKIRFRDLVAQPRKIISSPTWSGIESEEITYSAGWTNVHELIPWRTLTGRQHFYQDHLWMLAFGEGFTLYKPPIDTKTIDTIIEEKDNGNPQVVLNSITPHQKTLMSRLRDGAEPGVTLVAMAVRRRLDAGTCGCGRGPSA